MFSGWAFIAETFIQIDLMAEIFHEKADKGWSAMLTFVCQSTCSKPQSEGVEDFLTWCRAEEMYTRINMRMRSTDLTYVCYGQIPPKQSEITTPNADHQPHILQPELVRQEKAMVPPPPHVLLFGSKNALVIVKSSSCLEHTLWVQRRTERTSERL